jgi:hypothetical protein
MQKWRRPVRVEPPEPTDAELAEFVEIGERDPIAPADPAFRERLRDELWELLQRLARDPKER